MNKRGPYKIHNQNFQGADKKKNKLINTIAFIQIITDALTINFLSSPGFVLLIDIQVPKTPPATPMDEPRIAKIVPVSTTV